MDVVRSLDEVKGKAPWGSRRNKEYIMYCKKAKRDIDESFCQGHWDDLQAAGKTEGLTRKECIAKYCVRPEPDALPPSKAVKPSHVTIKTKAEIVTVLPSSKQYNIVPEIADEEPVKPRQRTIPSFRIRPSDIEMKNSVALWNMTVAEIKKQFPDFYKAGMTKKEYIDAIIKGSHV